MRVRVQVGEWGETQPAATAAAGAEGEREEKEKKLSLWLTRRNNHAGERADATHGEGDEQKEHIRRSNEACTMHIQVLSVAACILSAHGPISPNRSQDACGAWSRMGHQARQREEPTDCDLRELAGELVAFARCHMHPR